MNNVIAILCSDLHLSETAPVARAAEPDWFEAQRRPLLEIEGLSHAYRCPVIIAGDIFDRWNASPAIINFALRCLPNLFGLYAIPGQHDLPNHSMKEIKRSAYWTLVEAGKIRNLCYGEPFGLCDDLVLHGFPWGSEIRPLKVTHTSVHFVNLAVMHQYVYTLQGIRGDGYPGAPKEKMLSRMGGQLEGFDAAVFGDNHKGFMASARLTGTKVNVMNCGTMLRRKQDEREYKPQVGLLKDDGTIDRHYLDVSEDMFSDPAEVLDGHGMDLDSAEFLEELKSLGGDSLDFRAAIMRRLEQSTQDVRRAVLEAIGE